jgi:hypothetical protein
MPISRADRTAALRCGDSARHRVRRWPAAGSPWLPTRAVRRSAPTPRTAMKRNTERAQGHGCFALAKRLPGGAAVPHDSPPARRGETTCDHRGLHEFAEPGLQGASERWNRGIPPRRGSASGVCVAPLPHPLASAACCTACDTEAIAGVQALPSITDTGADGARRAARWFLVRSPEAADRISHQARHNRRPARRAPPQADSQPASEQQDRSSRRWLLPPTAR